jgi:hypothetical protein
LTRNDAKMLPASCDVTRSRALKAVIDFVINMARVTCHA